MIRMKYYKSWPAGVRPTAAKFFERLTDNIGSPRNQAEPPLRDSISKAYMHKFMGAHMVKGDWFSVMTWLGYRIPMYDLTRENRFVLAVLNDSRIKRNNPGIALEQLNNNDIWRFLAHQEFDVWLKATDEDFREVDGQMTGEEPCVIENYPFYGESVEVTVLPSRRYYSPEMYERLYLPDIYKRIDEPRRYVPESALHIGPDGRYYTDCANLKEAFTSCWMTDIEDTLRRLFWKLKKDRSWYLTDITREWTADTFLHMIDGMDGECFSAHD
ncbi:MAG: hypothetical protein LUI87_15650 [Lachnospiraceae bacterium]|nr:hypothetical protein [Lachnospiraceae bacterium]